MKNVELTTTSLKEKSSSEERRQIFGRNLLFGRSLHPNTIPTQQLEPELQKAIAGTISAILFGQSFFEMIDLATVARFVNRYLFTHSKRQRLGKAIA